MAAASASPSSIAPLPTIAPIMQDMRPSAPRSLCCCAWGTRSVSRGMASSPSSSENSPNFVYLGPDDGTASCRSARFRISSVTPLMSYLALPMPDVRSNTSDGSTWSLSSRRSVAIASLTCGGTCLRYLRHTLPVAAATR